MLGGDQSGFLISLSNEFIEHGMILGVNKVNPIYKIVPKPEIGEIQFDETIPRLLLRRKYVKKYPLFEYTLCNFTETMDYVKKGQISVTDIEPIYYNSELNTLGFSEEFIKVVSDEKQNNYIVSKALACRLLVAKKYESIFTNEGDSKSRLWIQLFMDTHIDLCVYLMRHENFEDSCLLNEDKNEEGVVSSVLEMKYPFDNRVYYCGELPDITPCVDVGNIWYDIRPRSDCLVSAIIHLLSKTQPHKCQLRNFARILYTYFEKFPILVKLFRLIIVVGLLGNYLHAKYRPQFQKRVQIVHSLSEEVTSDKQFFYWIVEQERLVYIITREWSVYNIEQQGTLNVILSETSAWDSVKENIKEGMDYSRAMFCRNATENPFFGINSFLKINHEAGLTYLSKLRKGDFCEIMANIMMQIIIKKNMNEAAKIREHFNLNDANAFDVIGNYLAGIPPRDLKLGWLKLFAITQKGYDLILDLYYRYEVLEEADHAIKRHIISILNNSERDFFIIYKFAKSINTSIAFKSFNLTHEYVLNQSEALKKKLMLLPWEDLKPDDDLCYYCPSCKKWASPYILDNVAKTHSNCYAQGLIKTLYDTDTNQLYCGKKAAPGASKKRKQGDLENETGLEFINPCVNTKLVAVHMLGKVQKLDNKLWALCEICGHLTSWEGTKFCCNGFACIAHRPEITSKDIIKYKGVLDSALACIYCGITESGNDKQLIPIKIVDDESNDWSIIDALICVDDYQHVDDILRGGGVGMKKLLIDLINRGRTFKGK